MADTSIVSRAELEAIASASGFAVWELEQVVADGNFRFLVELFRAGELGVVVNPEQALQAPSIIGQVVQDVAESEFVESINDALDIALPSLKGLGAVAIAFGIVLLVIVLKR